MKKISFYLLIFTFVLSAEFGFKGCSNGDLSFQTITAESSYKYFVYVSNATSTTVSAFESDPSSGKLTSVGTYALTSATPSSISVDPTGDFLYVANSTYIDGFRIDRSTGKLSTLGGFPINVGLNIRAIKVSPTGSYLYLVTTAGAVTIYSIRRSNGDLSVINTTTAGGNGGEISVDPDTRFVYIVNDATNIYSYKVATDGSLVTTSGSPAAGSSPRGIAVGKDGKYVFVTNAGNGLISVYSVDTQTGNLTLDATKGLTSHSGAGVYHASISANGNQLFVTNNSGGLNCLDIFTISDGKLSYSLDAAVSAGAGNCEGVVSDPLRDITYFVDNAASGQVHGYSFDQLNSIYGSPFSAGTAPNRVTVVAIPQ